MKKFKKVILLITIVVIVITVGVKIKPYVSALYYAVFHENGFFMPNQSKIEKILERDYNALEYMGEYFINTDCDYIIITVKYDEDIDYMKKDTGGGLKTVKTETPDGDLKHYLDYINDKNYSHVTKIDNYITFTYWENLSSSVSLLYCPDGEPIIDEDDLYEITVLKTSKEHWFYYKEVEKP